MKDFDMKRWTSSTFSICSLSKSSSFKPRSPRVMVDKVTVLKLFKIDGFILISHSQKDRITCTLVRIFFSKVLFSCKHLFRIHPSWLLYGLMRTHLPHYKRVNRVHCTHITCTSAPHPTKLQIDIPWFIARILLPFIIWYNQKPLMLKVKGCPGHDYPLKFPKLRNDNQSVSN